MQPTPNASASRERLVELIRATQLGARIATRGCRSEGMPDDGIRREVVARYRAILETGGFGAEENECLQDAVRRGIEEILGRCPSLRPLAV